jgi:hypothetical protein
MAPHMEPLPPGASLNDLQEYIRKMEVERGVTDRTITDQALKFGSEAGEVLDGGRRLQRATTERRT